MQMRIKATTKVVFQKINQFYPVKTQGILLDRQHGVLLFEDMNASTGIIRMARRCL